MIRKQTRRGRSRQSNLNVHSGINEKFKVTQKQQLCSHWKIKYHCCAYRVSLIPVRESSSCVWCVGAAVSEVQPSRGYIPSRKKRQQRFIRWWYPWRCLLASRVTWSWLMIPSRVEPCNLSPSARVPRSTLLLIASILLRFPPFSSSSSPPPPPPSASHPFRSSF